MNPLAKPDQRVGVFIDAQNIYHSAKNFYQRKVDFGRLINILTGERKLICAFAYVIKTDLFSKELNFFSTLIEKGIKLRIKELISYPDGTKKADWDVGLTVDAIRFSSNLDVIILVSGDGDFLPLVEYLMNLGKQVEVAGFGQNTSVKLKEVCDYFYNLDELRRLILIK